jgi:hypothetical protein
MGTSTYLDQLYSTRPVVGHADYRMPIPGLRCGASTYPGGGVTGAPGHNAARKMIRDFRARRWIKGTFRIELRSSSQEGQSRGRAEQLRLHDSAFGGQIVAAPRQFEHAVEPPVRRDGLSANYHVRESHRYLTKDRAFRTYWRLSTPV